MKPTNTAATEDNKPEHKNPLANKFPGLAIQNKKPQFSSDEDESEDEKDSKTKRITNKDLFKDETKGKSNDNIVDEAMAELEALAPSGYVPQKEEFTERKDVKKRDRSHSRDGKDSRSRKRDFSRDRDIKRRDSSRDRKLKRSRSRDRRSRSRDRRNGSRDRKRRSRSRDGRRSRSRNRHRSRSHGRHRYLCLFLIYLFILFIILCYTFNI